MGQLLFGCSFLVTMKFLGNFSLSYWFSDGLNTFVTSVKSLCKFTRKVAKNCDPQKPTSRYQVQVVPGIHVFGTILIKNFLLFFTLFCSFLNDVLLDTPSSWNRWGQIQGQFFFVAPRRFSHSTGKNLISITIFLAIVWHQKGKGLVRARQPVF